MNNLTKRIKEKFLNQFEETSGHRIYSKVYISGIEYNLLPGIRISDFQDDLQRGSGNELLCKFLAVHTSSALVVNTFAMWKKEPQTLKLCGDNGFDCIYFEKKFPFWPNCTPPNLDRFAENQTTLIRVESKFLEHLSKKQPIFSESYGKNNLRFMEEK